MNRIARRIVSSIAFDLKGPFKLLKNSPTQYELTVNDALFTNEEFIKLNMQQAGASDDSREDWNEPGDNTLSLKIEWFYEESDPGRSGGWSNDGYEVVAIDNILLENPEDRHIVTEAYENQIMNKMDDWAKDQSWAYEEDKAESLSD